MMMTNKEQRDLIHQQIILDLTIRTLERDVKYIDDLKAKLAFSEWFVLKIKEVREEKVRVKKLLNTHGIRIENEIREDDLITVYQVLYRGATEYLRYSNIALRNWTTEEIKRLLNIEYKTTNHQHENF